VKLAALVAVRGVITLTGPSSHRGTVAEYVSERTVKLAALPLNGTALAR